MWVSKRSHRETQRIPQDTRTWNSTLLSHVLPFTSLSPVSSRTGKVRVRGGSLCPLSGWWRDLRDSMHGAISPSVPHLCLSMPRSWRGTPQLVLRCEGDQHLGGMAGTGKGGQEGARAGVRCGVEGTLGHPEKPPKLSTPLPGLAQLHIQDGFKVPRKLHGLGGEHQSPPTPVSQQLHPQLRGEQGQA